MIKSLNKNQHRNNLRCLIKRLYFLIEYMIILLSILFLTWSYAQGQINNDPNCGCLDIRISNITSNYAVISWTTPYLTESEVHYGTDLSSLTNIAFDKRGQDFISSRHYHPLSNLDVKTQYFYQIVQNNEVCSEGSFFTGPNIGLPGFSPTVYGQTFYPDGTPFEKGAIIYVRIQTDNGVSSLLSTLTIQQGGWTVNLSPRTDNLEYYFSFKNEDSLLIEGIFGQPCFTGSLENPISESLVPNLVQVEMDECPTEFEMNLSAGWSMISLPLIQDNASVSSIFPEAVVVYGYKKDSGYVRVQSLEPGRGYWILMNSPQSYKLTGQPIYELTKTVNEDKWDMIGGCTFPAKAAIDSCNIDVIYKYSQRLGYQRIPGSEYLTPGAGYWILLSNVINQCVLTVKVAQ